MESNGQIDNEGMNQDNSISSPQQPNRFGFKNVTGTNDNRSSGKNDNSTSSKEDKLLKNKIHSNASAAPKKENQLKSGNKKPSMPSLNSSKAGHAMNSIQNNRNKANNQQDQDGEKPKSVKDQVGEEATKAASSALLQSVGVPKVLADSLAEKYGAKAYERIKKQRRRKIIMACLPAAVFIFLILAVVTVIAGDDDSFGGSSSATSLVNSNTERLVIVDYYEGFLSETELYNLLKENGMICTESNDCSDLINSVNGTNVIKFFKSLKDNSANKDMFLKYYFAVSLDREYEETYNTVNTGELSDFINNIKDIKKYLLKYRFDGDTSKAEDMYQRILSYVDNIDNSFYDGSNNVIGSYCSTITIGDGEFAGTYDLEDYVAGVLQKEMVGNSSEYLKAQAIVIRTLTVSKTENCTLPLVGVTNFEKATNTEAITAATSTKGIIAKDEKGNQIDSGYDNFCYKVQNPDDYILMQNSIAVPKTWVSSNISNSSTMDEKWYYVNCPCDTSSYASEAPAACTVDNIYKDGGTGNGMSKYGALYLASIGKTYEEILKSFYGDTIILMDIASSAGLQADTTGFLMRVKRAYSPNKFYYDGAYNISYKNGYLGECVWYAIGRINEIYSSIGSSNKWTTNQNGGQFCSKASANGLTAYSGEDAFNHLKQGSIISWNYGKYGHVAIIEKVIYSNDGTPTITLSEGGLGFEGVVFPYVYNGTSYISTVDIDVNNTLRINFCETNGKGCQKIGGVLKGKTEISTDKHTNTQSFCVIPLMD